MYELASRKRRFFAVLVDIAIFGIIIYLVLQWYPFDESAKNVPYMKAYVENRFSKSNIYRQIIFNIIAFLVNYPFLRNGQTIGKRLLNIQVTDIQGNVASIWRMYFLRGLIFNQIIDVLDYSINYFLYSYYLFDNNSIGLQSLLSSMDYFETGLFMLGKSIVLADLLFICRSDRRCIHDFFAGTIVIRRIK